MKLIGLAGQKQHGKSTVCNILRSKYQNIVPYSFAKPLKEVCRVLFGGGEEHWYGSLKEEILPEWGLTARQIMQTVGTDLFRRHFRNDFWVKAAEVQFERVRQYHIIIDYKDPLLEPVIVVDDVRFENEAKVIIDHGGVNYRIINDNIPIKMDAEHESEKWLDACYFAAELHASTIEDAEKNAHFIARENALCLITTP